MNVSFRWSLAALLLCATVGSAQEKYKIKTEKSAPPKELNDAIAKLMDSKAVKLMDKNGKVVAEFWFRNKVPASPIADPNKKNFGYRDISETEILAAVKFHEVFPDYRRQKIKPGVYTLRLGYQPVDGNHIGASKHDEFCLAVAADKDTKAETMDTKAVVKMSMVSIKTAHPAILMLFPPAKKATESPELVPEEMDHAYIAIQQTVTVNGKDAGTLGLSLGVAGVADE